MEVVGSEKEAVSSWDKELGYRDGPYTGAASSEEDWVLQERRLAEQVSASAPGPGVPPVGAGCGRQ